MSSRRRREEEDGGEPYSVADGLRTLGRGVRDIHRQIVRPSARRTKERLQKLLEKKKRRAEEAGPDLF
jgi:hypothetical protein